MNSPMEIYQTTTGDAKVKMCFDNDTVCPSL
ncbi:hypothetical protein SAMN02745664_11210 [Moraxella cuniculi DSM 21768]|uniref:Uncharacterized protein n=2 Tax=Moraxella cuniculi TaxID=34061 RepID=A0A1N7FCK5_9GAMM|nr:hypothetical protein SAMN02745664_11210 [Moraxella cuniculi DSM 21768]VEG12307.1 Uncharacterised protein [Moraxella cuniculi]